MSEMQTTYVLETQLAALDTKAGTINTAIAAIKTELEQGYTAEEITAAGAETVAVKATPGKVARIRVVTAVITVTPQDGAGDAWGALTNAAELDLGGTPMQFTTNIGLKFSGAGSAWILYK